MDTTRTSLMCYARRINDQMQCGKCGLAWDIDDPEPPQCKNEVEVPRSMAKFVMNNRVGKLGINTMGTINVNSYYGKFGSKFSAPANGA